MLRLPVYGRPYTIHVDASKSQLGCALLQEQEERTLMPVGYWSRTLIPAELNYSTTERECVWVVWAVLHLRPYVERTRFTVRTDHDALKWALCLAKAQRRLAKWRLRLAEFHFDVVYRPGVTHSVPDALSRVETTRGDQGALEDEMLCFPVEGPWSHGWNFVYQGVESSTSPCNRCSQWYLTSGPNRSSRRSGCGNRQVKPSAELRRAKQEQGARASLSVRRGAGAHCALDGSSQVVVRRRFAAVFSR